MNLSVLQSEELTFPEISYLQLITAAWFTVGNSSGTTQSKEMKFLIPVAELFLLGFKTNAGVLDILHTQWVHIYIYIHMCKHMEPDTPSTWRHTVLNIQFIINRTDVKVQED
jgi:hypothetical protein